MYIEKFLTSPKSSVILLRCHGFSSSRVLFCSDRGWAQTSVQSQKEVNVKICALRGETQLKDLRRRNWVVIKKSNKKKKGSEVNNPVFGYSKQDRFPPGMLYHLVRSIRDTSSHSATDTSTLLCHFFLLWAIVPSLCTKQMLLVTYRRFWFPRVRQQNVMVTRNDQEKSLQSKHHPYIS